MKMRTATSMLALAGFGALTATASAQLEITEVYIGGLSGDDGTVDWFELTNFGSATESFAAGDLVYEDESRDPLDFADLPAFTLASGESWVFLLDDNADALTDFDALWGTGINRGLVDGSGLGGSGDEANVYVAGQADPFDSFLYASQDASASLFGTRTFDALNGGFSMVGVNGAFASNTFANDQVIPGQTDISLIGSPGVAVPEPATAALLGLGAAAMLRRRSA